VTTRLCPCLAIAALSLLGALVAEAEPLRPADEEGFTSLFDGKTLCGWTIDCLPKDREQ
jgi:hypothetical protein